MNNPPAFPVTFKTVSDAYRLQMEHFSQEGMTLRDYFAAIAMHATAINLAGSGLTSNVEELIAEAAYKMADAMLKAREQQ